MLNVAFTLILHTSQEGLPQDLKQCGPCNVAPVQDSERRVVGWTVLPRVFLYRSSYIAALGISIN